MGVSKNRATPQIIHLKIKGFPWKNTIHFGECFAYFWKHPNMAIILLMDEILHHLGLFKPYK